MTETAEKTEKAAKVPLGTNYWKLWSASVISNLGDGVALALGMPWLVSAAGLLILFVHAGPKLTTEAIETTRAEGIAAKESSSE
jgi:hypothetical protein